MRTILTRGAAFALTLCLCSLPAFPQPVAGRSVVSLDKDWSFYPLPDFQLWPPAPRLTAAQVRQLSCPQPGRKWQPVQLPDDYVVRGEFAPDPNPSMLAGGAVCPLGGRECEIPNGSPPQGKPGALNRPGRNAWAGHGYLPVYPAWYRRSISVPASAKGKSVWLDFGGVYRDAVVFVNGQFLEEHPGGYTGFRLNITSAVRFGEDNDLAVFVDPRWFEGWWYEGGGIYRHVRLIVTDRLQISPWGTFVRAEVPGPIHRGSAAGDRAAARLTIETTVRNDHPDSRNFTLVSQVIDRAGRTVASTSSAGQLDSGRESTFRQDLALPDALLWSLEHPNLYRLATAIRVAGAAVDRELTAFGVRTIRFDPDRGFFLNGQRVEIRGVCDHHDFPGVGTAAPDNLWRWRLRKHQGMGANALRTAHNPASDALYQAADEMGMLVMDENRHLGDTYFPKAVRDTPFSDLADLKAMVLQHRNHPSIIMWSLCNEEGQGPTPYGAKMFAAMKEAVRKIDPARPVTAGVNGGYKKEGLISVEDILGMNYHNAEFAANHAAFPGLMIFGSEDANAKTSRGTPASSRADGLCAESGQPWRSWVSVAETPYVAGQFIWTGFDYRGEPNPYSWPAVTSQTGAMDLAGFPKPVYYYWRAWWREEPSVYLFPAWNLRERRRQECPGALFCELPARGAVAQWQEPGCPGHASKPVPGLAGPLCSGHFDGDWLQPRARGREVLGRDRWCARRSAPHAGTRSHRGRWRTNRPRPGSGRRCRRPHCARCRQRRRILGFGRRRAGRRSQWQPGQPRDEHSPSAPGVSRSRINPGKGRRAPRNHHRPGRGRRLALGPHRHPGRPGAK